MIEIPDTCPSCQSKLDRVQNQLFCRNKQCGDKQKKVIQGYCQKISLRGLGPATIDKLGLTTIPDIYELDEKTTIDIIGEKLGIKLMEQIEKAKTLSLGTFLSANAIYLIGSSAAKKIDAITSNPNELTYDKLKDVGLGDKASQSLIKWLEDEYIPLPITFTDVIKENNEPAEMKVCITGRLQGYTKATATALLKTYNIDVVSTVNQADVLLLAERKGSAKEIQAEKQNKRILTMDELLKATGQL